MLRGSKKKPTKFQLKSHKTQVSPFRSDFWFAIADINDMQLINQELHPLKELRYSSETDPTGRSGFLTLNVLPRYWTCQESVTYSNTSTSALKNIATSSLLAGGVHAYTGPPSPSPTGQHNCICKAWERRHHQGGSKRKLKASSHLKRCWRNQSRCARQDELGWDT